MRQKSPGRLEQARDPPTCSYLLAKDRDMEKKINLTYYEEFKARVNLTETIIHFPVDVYEFSNEIKRLEPVIKYLSRHLDNNSYIDYM